MSDNAAGDGPSQPAHCVAVKSQLFVYDWEDDLDRLARTHHRTCAWWWGIRRAGPRYGARCYICDKTFTTWSHKYPMTATAKRAVEEHKMHHRLQTLPSTAGRS